MGLNFKLIQRTAKTSTSDVTHSSGYAGVSNGGSFGASDNTTFSERMQIERNRKLIKGYNNAKVARGVNHMPMARSYEQEQAMQAAMAAMAAGERKYGGATRQQEFANRQERGGLKKYDLRMKQGGTINHTAGVAPANSRQAAADMRAARAERFSARARPTPKTGGFGR